MINQDVVITAHKIVPTGMHNSAQTVWYPPYIDLSAYDRQTTQNQYAYEFCHHTAELTQNEADMLIKWHMHYDIRS